MSVYITTPIYYTNDKPHIGHAYTTIACDIFARFSKLSQKDVFFLSGTDEHGQKVEKAAKEAHIDPKKFVDNLSLNFEKLVNDLGCEINDFIRTTEIRHRNAAQSLWIKLKENNQIYLSNYEGWYSIRDEAFYQESELKKIDDKYFTVNDSPVEWVKEQSYFFKLSDWQNKLINFYENNPDKISPKSRYNEVLSFIKSGLKDLSISRNTFKWGVPVPKDANHVMYVWIDALCNYLTAIDYPNIKSDKFKKYWPAIHIVGKDILRFHAVYWPAFLMAADLEPPKKIFAHGWWTNEGKKISKSLGNVIDPYEIINEYGLDQIRYFLFREVPFGNDGNFSKKSISTRVNADLSNNYGNLIQRISTFIVKNCDSKILPSNNLNDTDIQLLSIIKNVTDKYFKNMDNMRISSAIEDVMNLLNEANAYVDSQAPWKLKNSDPERMKVVLYLVINIIIKSSIMLFPIIPKSAEKALSFFNISKDNISFKDINSLVSHEIIINNPEPLFPRIDND